LVGPLQDAHSIVAFHQRQHGSIWVGLRDLGVPSKTELVEVTLIYPTGGWDSNLQGLFY